MHVFLDPMRTAVLAVVCCGLSPIHVARSEPASAPDSDAFRLTLSKRVPGPEDKVPRRVTWTETWDPLNTAVIVCDMWDAHHCLNATKRGGEMAPRMNAVIQDARRRGSLIIHAPSSCMKFYDGHPARARALNAPRASNVPGDIGSWCHWIDSAEEAVGYPIDHSDGGEDDDPVEHQRWREELSAMGRNPGAPWIRQTETLEIDPDLDAITDDGVETWNLLEARGIDHVILMGVHVNMCVLGRPFGLRQMAKNGKDVVLMRDMTDAMYNPARRPYVSHFRGTELVVEHIEKNVCPTITSDQTLGGEPFRFEGDVRPRVVVAIAEREYRTTETLGGFAENYWGAVQGHQVTVLRGDPKAHHIPGFAESVRDADVVILSVRRQALPADDISALRGHLAAGKPLIGIRTSSHAFDARGQGPEGHLDWPRFDPEVLGGNYHGHHANGLTVAVHAVGDHPLLAGVEPGFTSRGSLYKVSPISDSALAVLLGSVEGHAAEPVAWVHHYGPEKAKVFYTSLGHPGDFENPAFLKLLVLR